MNIDRDFELEPITAVEAISLFKNEMMELALASPSVIEEASNLAEAEGSFDIVSDIVARYEDYQEELRCMASAFL